MPASTSQLQHGAQGAAAPHLIPGGKGRPGPQEATQLEKLLAPLVRELTVLSVTGKQAHWHVKGANFLAVHELLDDIVAHVRDWSDTVAERLIALGIPLDATINAVSANGLPPFPTGFLTSDTVIEHYTLALDAVISSARKTVDPLGEIDPVSQDVIIEVLRGLDKDRWFLSHSYSNLPG